MNFFVVYKERNKLQHNPSISEYVMLKMIAKQIEEEDIKVEYATQSIQYIGLLPSCFENIRDYVDYSKEHDMSNQPVLVVFNIDRNKRITKIFKRGVSDLANFVKSSDIDSKEEQVYFLNKEFKTFDSLITDETRNAIGRMIMNSGMNNTVSALKYEYVGAKISVKNRVAVV